MTDKPIDWETCTHKITGKFVCTKCGVTLSAISIGHMTVHRDAICRMCLAKEPREALCVSERLTKLEKMETTALDALDFRIGYLEEKIIALSKKVYNDPSL